VSVDLATALRYYGRHGCIVFWNPCDITEENLRTDTPDAEALIIQPGNIISCETEEGQYLVKDGQLQQYESYPRHRGIDKIFTIVQRTRWDCRTIAAISHCVQMGWEIMEGGDRNSGVFAKRYAPKTDN
jgi:hypothetical protein